MLPAPVGFQCPEEVADARRAAPRTRATLGGTVGRGITDQGRVTQLIIALCIGAYVLQGLPGLSLSSRQFNEFTVDYGLLGVGLALGEYYRLLTPAFLHAGLLHLFLNMYALYLIGSGLERVLGLWRYVALFVTSAVGGNTLVYLVDGLSASAVGASTAVFGFLSAAYLVARRLGFDTRQLAALIGLNLLISFLPGISLLGHLGGLATGAVLGAVFTLVPARRELLQAGLVALVLGGLVAAAVYRTETLAGPF
jgi:membrane associated rhomboid family serine protease